MGGEKRPINRSGSGFRKKKGKLGLFGGSNKAKEELIGLVMSLKGISLLITHSDSGTQE